MAEQWGALARTLLTLLFVGGRCLFHFEEIFACGVCKDVLAGWDCARYNACHLINTSSISRGRRSARACASFCEDGGTEASLSLDAHIGRTNAVEEIPDVRVTKGFGRRDYNQVRVSVISSSATPPVADFFDYSARFVHKWTDNFLHTAMKTVPPGTTTSFSIGADVRVRLPKQGAGVAGVLLADPCIRAGILAWVSCTHGEKYQTSIRTPGLINAFVADDSTDFWGILGDNFYDRSGDITKSVFAKISLQAKSKIFLTVPGNHDYWVLGSPWVGTPLDQCGNGHLQFYAQDAKAAENVSAGSATAPFDLSVNPWLEDSAGNGGCVPAAGSNFFWYNQIGNVGLVGQSGAYSLEEASPFMAEACAWLGTQPGLEVALLLGHWDVGNLGASDQMAMPQWYTEMAALPGCAELDARGALKFVMGHTHCNDPHPHGKVGIGFRVAGFGMPGPCSNYGMPIVDTTSGRVRFWYFDTSSDALYNTTVNCVFEKGWRQCTDLATLWLDQPLPDSASTFDEVLV